MGIYEKALEIQTQVDQIKTNLKLDAATPLSEVVTTTASGGGKLAPKFISFAYGPKDLDISEEIASIDTSNITDMSEMFYMCYSITDLTLNTFNTSNVTNMYGMFTGASYLTYLDLNSLDTSNVTDIRSMFSSCTGLKTLKVGDLDISKVKSFYQLFNQCSALSSFDANKWDVSHVTNFQATFYGCKGFTELDLSNWHTTSATTMQQMFYNVPATTTKIDIRNFDFTNVQGYSSMFGSNSKDTLIIVKGETEKQWLTSKFTNLTNVKTVAEYEAS